MELELATTEDIINELFRRDVPFVLLAFQNTNQPEPSISCACSGLSRRELAQLLRLFEEQLRRSGND